MWLSLIFSIKHQLTKRLYKLDIFPKFVEMLETKKLQEDSNGNTFKK
jgi:hypothetical protein